jgi:hypothetical protein
MRSKREPVSAEERFTRAWQKRGAPRWRMAELWLEECRKSAEAERGRKGKRKP